MVEQQLRSSNRRRSASGRLRAISIAALIALGCTAMAPTAGARSIYRGAFDPLDISGTVDIDVPDSCLGTGSGWNFVDATTCGGGDTVDVVDALVNIVYTPPDTGPSSIQFNGPPPGGTGGYTGVVTGLYWENDVLQAITTSMFGSSSSPTGYFLQFGAIPHYTGNQLDGVPTTSVDLLQYVCVHTDLVVVNSPSTNDGGTSNCSYKEIDPEVPTRQISYTRVPEPGSVALVLGALGAGWLGLRRRRA